MIRQAVDLKEQYCGDLILEGGDLIDTSLNTWETYYQIIKDILNTEPKGNRYFPDMGIDLDSFRGQRNTRELGSMIARYVKEMISQQSFLYKNEIDIEAFPTGKESIALKITLKTIGDSQGLLVVYNTEDNMFRTLGRINNGLNFVQKTVVPPTINRLI